MLAIETITTNAALVISIVIGIYEVIARAIPTVKDITVIGNVVKVLSFISDSLNTLKAPASAPAAPVTPPTTPA